MHERFRGREHAAESERGHAMLLSHRPAKILRETSCPAEDADVSRDDRGDRSEKAELHRAGAFQSYGVTSRRQQDYIRRSIRELVKDFTGFGFQSAFHRHQPIEQIAEEPQLDADRGPDIKQRRRLPIACICQP